MICRSKKFFENARAVAHCSNYKFKHGAILVRGGSIIKSAYNKGRPVSFLNKFHKNNRASLHAEIGCILNLDKRKTANCDIYVIRLDAAGKFALSKPCAMCQLACKEMNIRRIYYSVDENNFEMLKL